MRTADLDGDGDSDSKSASSGYCHSSTTEVSKITGREELSRQGEASCGACRLDAALRLGVNCPCASSGRRASAGWLRA